MFAALLKNGEFKERFVKTFMDMANYNFSPEKVLDRLDELSDLYCDAIVVSHRRFLREDYSEADYERELSVLKDFYKNRYQYITAYLKPDFSLQGQLVDILIEKADIPGGEVGLNTLIIGDDEMFSGKYYSDYPISLYAHAYEGYEFAGWKIENEIIFEPEIILSLDKGYVIKPMWKEKK